MPGKSSHVELHPRLDLFLWSHSDISATFLMIITKSTNGLSYINKLLFSLKFGFVASPCKLNTNKASVYVCAAGVFRVCPARRAACSYKLPTPSVLVTSCSEVALWPGTGNMASPEPCSFTETDSQTLTVLCSQSPSVSVVRFRGIRHTNTAVTTFS